MVLTKDTEKSLEPMSDPRERHFCKKQRNSSMRKGQAIFNHGFGKHWPYIKQKNFLDLYIIPFSKCKFNQ